MSKQDKDTTPYFPYLVFRIIALLLLLWAAVSVVLGFTLQPEYFFSSITSVILALVFWAIADIGLCTGRIETMLKKWKPDN